MESQGGLPLVKDNGLGGQALSLGQCKSLAQLRRLKAKEGWHPAKSAFVMSLHQHLSRLSQHNDVGFLDRPT
ncbi:hypothetical protein GCM10011363_37980 [Marivita lacus]|uniref:Uncharacterized protein n=1 Tax=Marivita lacus TaxID=1323742 RepID=A0ABQ1L1G2_9RHOB|nr:hypothetical protein GCM10011363_37980 [Marivita lacus]